MLSGVVVGVTVGIILELSRYLRMRYVRRQQTAHLREIIRTAYQSIRHDIERKLRDSGPAPDGRSPDELLPGFKIRAYQGLLADLHVILNDRADGLSYQQRYDLSRFLSNYEVMRYGLFGNKEHPPALLNFQEMQVFPGLRRIAWLKLSELGEDRVSNAG